MTVVSESFGKMPELERQEQKVGQQNTTPSAPTDKGEEENDNIYPPKLEAEETVERPILSLPKRLLEMAMTAIITHSKKEKVVVALSPPSLRPSVRFSFSSRCPSTDDLPSNATDSISQKDNERGGRKRNATANGVTDEQKEGPLRKRRRIGARNGQRRKRHGQRHNGRSTEGKNTKAEQKQHNDNNKSTSSLRMALIRLPKRAGAISAQDKKSLPMHCNEQSMSLLKRHYSALIFGNQSLGRVRRSVFNSHESFICYDAICHRSVPNVTIRIGDCVQINSADSEDDLFVGRVLAIRYQPEGRALQLTLLWFYTPRQLPSVSPFSKVDPHELFASKHLDSVNADSVDAVIHVLTFAEYCRYRAEVAINRQSNGRSVFEKESLFRRPCPPIATNYPRRDFLPLLGTPSDAVFFCRGVFSLTKKRTISFGCLKRNHSRNEHNSDNCKRIMIEKGMSPNLFSSR